MRKATKLRVDYLLTSKAKRYDTADSTPDNNKNKVCVNTYPTHFL